MTDAADPAPSATDTRTAGVIAPPPLLYLGFLVLGVVLEWFVIRTQGLDMPPSLRWTLVPLFLLAGAGCIAAALGRFRSANTPAPPWQPTTAFVATGIYRFTRNPMYLGMTLIYIGLAIAADAPVAFWTLVPLAIVIHYGVVVREENYMAARFGGAYVDYFHRVPRWL